MSTGGRLGFLEQLSSREKGLVGGVALLAFGVIGFLGWLYVDSTLAEIQEEIDINSEFVADIEKASAEYAFVRARCNALEERLQANSITSLRIPVNNIARSVSLEGGKKLNEEIGSLKQETETRMGPICKAQEEKGNRRKNKKPTKETEPSILRIEQDFEFRNIPLDAVFSFLDGIERSEELLYVTQLDIRRKFGDPEQAQSASVRVATYRLEGGAVQ